MQTSFQVVKCAVHIPETNEKFICSAIFSSNCEAERQRLWVELRGTESAYKHLDKSWIVMRDFNVTLSLGEHSHATSLWYAQAGMTQFQEVVGDCSLTDLVYAGALFT